MKRRDWKRHIGNLLAFLFGFALAIVGFFAGYQLAIKRALNTTSLGKLQSTLDLIQNQYVDSVSIDSVIENTIPLLLHQLDPHSTYFTAKEQEQENEVLAGSFYGVGISFNMIKDTAIVVSVVPDGPSDLVGISPGDRIVKVDDLDISGKNIPADSIRTLLKGANNSIVNMSIYRPYTKELVDIDVKRAEVKVDQVEAAYMINDSLGCIKLARFSINTHNDFVKAYAKLSQKGMKGLVLDLRDNPGGLVHAALTVSNEFLDRGRLLIYTEGFHSPRSDIYSDGTGNLKHLPVYVLVNESSASSAEIVSGALQDNDAAIIIGRRTFGKGLVQKLYDFSDGSSVHLTISRYFTPSGRSIQREYRLGNEIQYQKDYIDRINGDEMYHADSISISEDKVFHTISGRKVYGGGGIIPDVFVPRDTTGYNSYFREVAYKGLLAKFGFIYSDNYRDLLTRLGSADACYDFLKNQGIVWQFARYATTQGVRMRNYLVYLSHDLMFDILSSIILSNIYDLSEASRVLAHTDPMVSKAAELFSQSIFSPSDLPDPIVEKEEPVGTFSEEQEEDFLRIPSGQVADDE